MKKFINLKKKYQISSNKAIDFKMRSTKILKSKTQK